MATLTAAKLVQAIRHVGFEDLGSFEASLREAGYAVEYVEAASGAVATLDPLRADVLIVLGGPIGAYEEARYPFVADELLLLRARLGADRPTLGLCLGAQLIAAALGARVYPGPAKEIGWSPLDLTEDGGVLAPLADAPVLHWHGDTFDLPDRATLLASTHLYRHQAFSRGANVLGLQFHVEVRASGLEHWLVGHACELAQAGLDPVALRADAARHAPPLEERARKVLGRWLAGLDARP